MKPFPSLASFVLVAMGMAGCLDARPVVHHAGEVGSVSATPAWTLDLKETGAVTLATSGDGTTLAVALLRGPIEGGLVYVIDAAAGRIRFNYSYPYAFCCTFPPVALDASGQRLLVGGNQIHLLNAATGERVAVYDPPLDGAKFPELPVNVDLSPDGRLAAAPTWEANRLVVLTPDQAPAWEANFSTNKVFGEARISADGQKVALAYPGRVNVYDAKTGRLLDQYFPASGGSNLPSLAVSRDGGRVATLAYQQDSLMVLVFKRDSQFPVLRRALAQGEYWGGVYMTPDADIVAAWSPGESFVFDGDGHILMKLGQKQRIWAFVPVDLGAVMVVHRGDKLEILHVAKGFQRSQGSIPFTDGYATLTAQGVVVATTVWKDGQPAATRIEAHAVPGLPGFAGGDHVGA